MPTKVDDLLLKKPFVRIMPQINNLGGYAFSDNSKRAVPSSNASYAIVSQDDFLREYDINGHKIWDELFYANRLKQDDEGRFYIHYVERLATNWQEIIATKQEIALCTNPIEFSVSNTEVSKDDEARLEGLAQGWDKKNMHVAFTNAVRECKITGDSAVCFYMNKGKIGWKVMSYRNGEVLYPHFDRITGELSMMARLYKQYADDAETVLEEFVDVWDNVNVTTYTRNTSSWAKKAINKTKEAIGLDSWVQVSTPKPHGFPFLPICYHREDEGACWSGVQSMIDEYELTTSSLLENNKMTAFRTLFIKGEGVDPRFDRGGNVNLIYGDKDSEAKWLERADVSNGFDIALKVLTENILMGSFTVNPPKLSGSDVSGTTVKLLYAPSLEMAIRDATNWNLFIDRMVDLFKFGYGLEIGDSAGMTLLEARGKIKPYVHQSEMELVTMINASVAAKTLSRKTANRINPLAVNYENERVEEEIKKEADGAKPIVNDGSNAHNDALEAVNQ